MSGPDEELDFDIDVALDGDAHYVHDASIDAERAAMRASLSESRRPLRTLVAGVFAYAAGLLAYVGARHLAAGADTLRFIDLSLLGAGAAALAVCWRHHAPLLLPRRFSARGVFAALFGLLASLVLGALLLTFFHDETVVGMRLHQLAGEELWRALVDRALVRSLAEELVFRGAVLTALLSVLRPRAALLAGALTFALCDLSWLTFVHLALLGWVLGKVRLEAGLFWCVVLRVVFECAVVWLQW